MHTLKKAYEEIKAEIVILERCDVLTLSQDKDWTPWY